MEGNSCLLCFETIKNAHKDNDNNYDYIDDIFQCCDRFLCEDIKGDSFHWNCSTVNNVPFCLRCLNSSKKLWLLEKKLKEISQELENYIVTFTEEIIIFRTERKGRGDQAETDQCNEAILGIPFHQLDPNEVETQSQDFPMENILVSSKNKNVNESSVVIEVFKQEPDCFSGDDNDNHFDDLDVSSPVASPDANIAVDESIFATENPLEQLKETQILLQRIDSNSLLKDYCKNWQNGNYPELRVSLQRLIFDCDGKPILNYYEPIKRKAAIAAAASLRSRSEQHDKNSFADHKRGRNSQSVIKGDDLWSGSDEEVNENSEDEIEEMGPSRKKRKKCQIRKSGRKEIFQCTVCSVQFNLAKELDGHSQETGHANERKFQCMLCPYKYFRKCDLKSHRKSHNFKGRNCTICGKFLETLSIYTTHRSSHHRNRKKSSGDEEIKSDGKSKKENREEKIKSGGKSEKRSRNEKVEYYGGNKKGPKFPCVVCQINFSILSDLIAHSEETGHVNEPEFQCKKCSNKYYRRVDLKTHKVIHKTPKPIPGAPVEREKPGKKPTKLKGEKYECIVCSAKFPNARILTLHAEEEEHANVRTFECEQCPNSFYRHCDLVRHQKSHKFGSKPCRVCGHVLLTYRAYKGHFEEKHKGLDLSAIEGFENFKFKCSICDKYFASEWDFNTHSNCHIGASPYKCDKCIAAYGQKTSLAEHLKAHRMNYVQCTICWELFRNEMTLKYHVKVHDNENRTKCDSCERTFAEKKHLIAHGIADHGKETPFKCKSCDSSFNYRKDFAFHVKFNHPAEYGAFSEVVKAYECNKCDNLFNTRSQLKYHVAHAHKNNNLSAREKKSPTDKSDDFACEYCGKICKTRKSINAHVKVQHLKIFPFVCHICGKHLSNTSALTIHLKIHTNETNDCQICGKGFSGMWNLKRHMELIHERNKKPRKSFRKTLEAVPKQPNHLDFPPTNEQQPAFNNI